MVYIRLLFLMLFLGTSAAHAEQKKCGAETCGTPTKTTKVINGVNHNCDSTTCSKSCCTLGDPPVCSIDKTTTSSCTAARVSPSNIQKYKLPGATTKQR